MMMQSRATSANSVRRWTKKRNSGGAKSTKAKKTTSGAGQSGQQTLEQSLERLRNAPSTSATRRQERASGSLDTMDQLPSCSTAPMDTDFAGPPLKRSVTSSFGDGGAAGSILASVQHNFAVAQDFHHSHTIGGGVALAGGDDENGQLSITLSKFRGNLRCSVPSISCQDQENVERFETPPTRQQFVRSLPPDEAENLVLRSHLPANLPSISWGNPERVWNLMCWKETIYQRNPQLFQRHPEIEPRMRAILLDWISEVCEVHCLHRETYHLAVDFVDRFLSLYRRDASADGDQFSACRGGIMKTQLQLVGITALFIAAKLEEIYPPKVAEFAYVTDGACTVEEIIDTEVLILETLQWQLCPVTTVHWLTVYLQLMEEEEHHHSRASVFPPTEDCLRQRRQNRDTRDTDSADRFHLPRYHRGNFLQLCQLVDLCVLDAASMRFPYGTIAAAAIYSLFEPQEVAFKVSGHTRLDLSACVAWMRPFALTIRDKGDAAVRRFADVPDDDAHNIQAHEVDLELMEKAKRHQLQTANYKTPLPQSSLPVGLQSVLLTPPDSLERPLAAQTCNYVPPTFFIGDAATAGGREAML